MKKAMFILIVVGLLSSIVLAIKGIGSDIYQLGKTEEAKYTAGLKKYALAQEPWLDENKVNKRVNSQIKRIKEDPNSPTAKAYLGIIDNSSLSNEQRKAKRKKRLLKAVSGLSLHEKQKTRLMELLENFDIKVTQNDFQTFLPKQAAMDSETQKMSSLFMQTLLLRGNKSRDFIDYYAGMPNDGSKKGFYMLHSDLHVYEKSPAYLPFYLAVIRDLLARTPDGHISRGRLDTQFMMVLRDLRAIGHFRSLEMLTRTHFEDPRTNNKARYAFVVAALHTQSNDVSLKLAKEYYTKYTDGIDEIVYLTKLLYWHCPREEIDPMVQEKIKKFMKPIEAIQKEIPKDRD